MENKYNKPTEFELKTKQDAENALAEYIENYNSLPPEILIQHLKSGFIALYRKMEKEKRALMIEREQWKEQAHKAQQALFNR